MSWRVDPADLEAVGAAAATPDLLKSWASFGLGPRLASVAEHVPAGEITADVGADHAHLLAALLERERIPGGWVVEINQAPLNAARATISKRALNARTEFRLGDGFQPLSQATDLLQVPSCACLCGVGGHLAARLLRAAPQSLSRIIFQVNHGHGALRSALCEEGWLIVDRSLVLERGRLFLNLVAARTSEAVEASAINTLSSAPHPLLEVNELLEGERLAPLWARTLQRRLRHRLMQSPHEASRASLREALAFLEKSALIGLPMFP
ncbi:MAG: class I SAM-dependent methyltransferase [Myxococcota bacterium]|nr:class I SAM-dependent methyltransferase [Myxococcota bacterium]